MYLFIYVFKSAAAYDFPLICKINKYTIINIKQLFSITAAASVKVKNVRRAAAKRIHPLLWHC